MKSNRSAGCKARRRLLIQVVLVTSLASSLLFPVKDAFAEWEREVRFKGIVTSEEEWGLTVAYGCYYCNVSVTKVFFDPNNTLSLSDVVTVCYSEPLSLEIGDEIECYGLNCIDYYSCPKQYVCKIVCKGNSYYAIPEFPSFILFPILMLAALLVGLAYRRKVVNR